MFQVIVAHSERIDTQDALSDLLAQCQSQLGGRAPGAALLFSALKLDFPTLLAGLEAQWPGLPLIGCTTDGELSSRKGFAEDSVTLTLFVSDQVRFASGVGRDLSANPQAACQQALDEAGFAADGEVKLCIVTPESLTTSAHGVLENLKQLMGGEIPVVGGTAGDYWQFTGTQQFHRTQALSNSAPVLLLSGPLTVSCGVASGWKPIGQPGVVTRATANLVHEIDHQPAIAYYRRFLGKHAQPTGDRPLALLDASGQVVGLSAPPGSVDEDGGVAYLGDIPTGTQVQLTVADRDDILDGSRASIQAARANLPAGARIDAGLFFSCSGRKFLLGSRVAEEESAIRQELPEIPFTGFYGYGEIGPLGADDTESSRFHNESFVTVLLSCADAESAVAQSDVAPAQAPEEEEPLARRVAILESKLARSERHRLLLEQLKDQTDALHQNVIGELEETNRIILESIRYASRIQRAILPDPAFFHQTFADHLILWEPRDLVGGDIYWHRPWGDGHLMVLGDCTGHGIPGAFMTLITNGALDRAIKEVAPGQTQRLMADMHRIVQRVLKQDLAQGESDDGMELGMLYLQPSSRRIIFSGARFPVFILSGGEVKEIKGDKRGIGYRGIPYDQAFTAHELSVAEGSALYLTSDGLIDQIGGEKNRSFGKKRFTQLLLDIADLPMAQQKVRLQEALAAWQGPNTRRDDVSVIGFKM
ncbi:FIST N-terminal domain-containing protein [Magnetofaba australis]|uniref:PPM-type phosphatase domain-containing protein n=1 Tax=Magnetofaba australis IT-1 TaxID=1434232 RepID=A0A1Y2K8W5_9PROT|nr:FIST N-terminal domain-containing protein [Magnetofaba australis]OSM06937.1 putative protein of unknown function DUF1745 [Magnetofaba australis IT-1]